MVIQSQRSGMFFDPRRPVPPADRRGRSCVPSSAGRLRRRDPKRRPRHGSSGRRRLGCVARFVGDQPFLQDRPAGVAIRSPGGGLMELGIFAKTFRRPDAQATLEAVRRLAWGACNSTLNASGCPVCPKRCRRRPWRQSPPHRPTRAFGWRRSRAPSTWRIRSRPCARRGCNTWRPLPKPRRCLGCLWSRSVPVPGSGKHVAGPPG